VVTQEQTYSRVTFPLTFPVIAIVNYYVPKVVPEIKGKVAFLVNRFSRNEPQMTIDKNK
jgi:hypothetical protein